MATQLVESQSARFISVEEYLSSSYDPDCEYDNGAIVERNLGEFEHSYLQTILATLFTVNAESWGVFGLTEQRIQISPREFLVPDICVLRIGDRTDDIVVDPPLITIEVMSPEDTKRRTAEKAAKYLEFGVKHVWVIDPAARAAYRGIASGLELVASGELAVPGTSIKVRVAELFEKLDKIRANSDKR